MQCLLIRLGTFVEVSNLPPRGPPWTWCNIETQVPSSLVLHCLAVCIQGNFVNIRICPSGSNELPLHCHTLPRHKQNSFKWATMFHLFQREEFLHQPGDSCAVRVFVNCVWAFDKLTKHWQKTITQEAALGRVVCCLRDTKETEKKNVRYKFFHCTQKNYFPECI